MTRLIYTLNNTVSSLKQATTNVPLYLWRQAIPRLPRQSKLSGEMSNKVEKTDIALYINHKRQKIIKESSKYVNE